MESELKSLRIDRSQRAPRSSDWAARWIVGGICVFLALGVARFAYSKLNAATEVEAVRVSASPSGAASTGDVILNATGYIVAHHKIEVAAKVIGRVAWIGVEKGDHVKQGQVIVRLEDDEYRAQVQQAKGSLANLEARLSELKNGSRPEEIEVTTANLEQAKADLVNYKVTLERTKQLVAAKVSPTQALDDAQAKYDGQVARVNSLIKTDKLSRLGPRSEQVTAMAGQVEQARGRAGVCGNATGRHGDPRAGDGNHPGTRGGKGRVCHHQLRGRQGSQGLCGLAGGSERPAGGTRHRAE